MNKRKSGYAVERSAGAVICHESKVGRLYLLLKHARKERTPREYWSFPKGHIEKGETSQDAARREIAEESGLRDVAFVPGFKTTERYVYRMKEKKILKFVVWFLARSRRKKVKISYEHEDAAWLPYEEAYARATYLGTKRILKKAHAFLLRHAS